MHRSRTWQGEVDDGRTEASPSWPLEPGLLRRLFLDLLGRPPLADERARWADQRAHELIDFLLGGTPFWEHWLAEQLWYFLLVDNFRPENEGVRELPQRLSAGRASARDALHRIALSPSFDLRNPGADTFVTVVMEQLGGMHVQKSARELEIGKGAYDGNTGRFLGHSASSQSDVVQLVIEDRGASRHFLARESERVTRAQPAKSELEAWTRSYHKDPWVYLELLRSWLYSAAYLARHESRAPLPNRLFVRTLFVDLMGRLPTSEEAEPLRGALDGLADSRPLRAVVARILLDAGYSDLPAKDQIEDPTQWVNGLFQRFLGRAGEREELRAFVTAFKDPACRPETIAYALLSSPEYHRY